MDLVLRARRAVPTLVAAVALGIGGCGEDDVKSGVDKGAEKAKDAKKEAKDAKEKAEQ